MVGGHREGDWVEGVGHPEGLKLPLGLAPLELEVFSPRSWRLLQGLWSRCGASHKPFLVD